MRIDEVDKNFGKLPQTQQNLPNGSKIDNKLLIGVAIIAVLGGTIFFMHKNSKRKKDLEK
jgi:hypothetical protein